MHVHVPACEAREPEVRDGFFNTVELVAGDLVQGGIGWGLGTGVGTDGRAGVETLL